MTAPSASNPTRVRPFAWSVRREIWEHSSLYIAPAAITGVVILGYLSSTVGMPHRRIQTLQLDAAHQSMVMGEPFAFAAAAIIAVVGLVAWFYCLGALFNERRDRSVLFWRSLPVSDLTATAAKAAIPMIVLPLLAFALVAVVEGVILLLSTLIVTSSGVSAAVPWTVGSIAEEGVVLAYQIVANVLWQAPVYGWFLLVSSWSKRSPFLWAILPPLALCLLEKLALGTTHLLSLLNDRLFGAEHHALVHGAGLQFNSKGPVPPSGLASIDLEKFVSSPGLWIGLVVAAAAFAATVWMRRRRDPI